MSDAVDTFNSFPRGRPVGMKGRKVIFQAGTNMLGIDPLTPLEKAGDEVKSGVFEPARLENATPKDGILPA